MKSFLKNMGLGAMTVLSHWLTGVAICVFYAVKGFAEGNRELAVAAICCLVYHAIVSHLFRRVDKLDAENEELHDYVDELEHRLGLDR